MDLAVRQWPLGVSMYPGPDVLGPDLEVTGGANDRTRSSRTSTSTRVVHTQAACRHRVSRSQNSSSGSTHTYRLRVIRISLKIQPPCCLPAGGLVGKKIFPFLPIFVLFCLLSARDPRSLRDVKYIKHQDLSQQKINLVAFLFVNYRE